MLAIYKRVSKDEQAEFGISLANQELRGKELAFKLGLEYEVYTDAGYKGSISFDKRPALNRLIDDIYSKKITALFVFDLNRLSRGNIIQIETLKAIFKEHDISLYELNVLIDLKDTNVEFITDIRSLVNAKFLKDLSATLKSNLESIVQLGQVTGGPMQKYGYTKDAKKMMVINEVEAKVVKLIFKLALEGKGTKVIANTLNDKGIQTKRNTSLNSHMIYRKKIKTASEFTWIDSTVYSILTATVYKGDRMFKGKIYKSPNLEIIDTITFDLVQEQLKTRNQFKKTTNKYEYLLKGLINCPKCGGRFYGKINIAGGNNNYACNSNRMGKSCGNRGINIEFLDTLICDSVLGMDVMAGNALSEQNQSTTTTMDLGELMQVDEDILSTRSKIENLLDLAEGKNIDPALFNERIIERRKELAALISKKEKLDKEYSIYQQTDKIIQIAKQAIKEFKKLKTFDDKRDFLRSIIQYIKIGFDVVEEVYGISIYFKLNAFESHLISRHFAIDRKLKEGKAQSKILKDRVSLSYSHYLDDTEDMSVFEVPFINLGEPSSFFKFKKD